MAAFVTGPVGLRTGHAAGKSSAVAARAAKRAAPGRKATTVMMAENLWKNQLVGGFPGGEGFFKRWLDDGMTGDVPDLKKEWQPGFNGGSEADVQVETDATEATSPSAVESTGEEPAAPAPAAEEGPDPALYMKYYSESYNPVNVAPEISLRYDKTMSEDFYRVGVAMTSVSGNATDLYFPKEYKNKAPVITIAYTPGSMNTASVSLSVQEIQAMPSVTPITAPGEVATTLVTDASTGRLKLDFSVDGASVNAYVDPRAIEKYEVFVGRK